MTIDERLKFYPKQVAYLTDIVQAAHQCISAVDPAIFNATAQQAKLRYDEAWKCYAEWLEK